MTQDPPRYGDGGENLLTEIRARPPEVIDDDWKDEIVHRMLRELSRQLHQLENTKPTSGREDNDFRLVNAKALASLERTLEKLMRSEEERATKRQTRVVKKNEDAVARIERRLVKLLAGPVPVGVARKPSE